MKSDYYAILGVGTEASPAEIKSAYRQLARQCHPDFHFGNKPEAEERMKSLNEAYDVLGDAEERAKYDRFGSLGHGREREREAMAMEKVGVMFDLFNYTMQKSTFRTRINIVDRNIRLTETWNNASNFAMGFGFLAAWGVADTFQRGDYDKGILQIVFSAIVGGGGCLLKWYSPRYRQKMETYRGEYERAIGDLDRVIDNLESKLI